MADRADLPVLVGGGLLVRQAIVAPRQAGKPCLMDSSQVGWSRRSEARVLADYVEQSEVADDLDVVSLHQDGSSRPTDRCVVRERTADLGQHLDVVTLNHV